MNKAEYEKRFAENQKITGYGLDTTMHMPCPFCAAPDWCSFKVIDTELAMAKEHVCSECCRGAKALFTRSPHGVSFEFVQTTGDPAPDYLPPIRRVDEDAPITPRVCTCHLGVIDPKVKGHCARCGLPFSTRHVCPNDD
jgi:hypothetical protein